MSIVSIESSIDRAKKLVRSKIRSMMDECKVRRFAMELHSELSCYTTRESGYGEILRMARRTISFLRPGHRTVAPIRDGTAASKGFVFHKPRALLESCPLLTPCVLALVHSGIYSLAFRLNSSWKSSTNYSSLTSYRCGGRRRNSESSRCKTRAI